MAEDPIDYERVLRSLNGLCVLLSPQFNLVNASENYLKTTMVKRENVMGRHFFDVFPDNPFDSNPIGLAMVKESFDRVLQTKQPVSTAIQKYDIPLPDQQEGFDERYWSGVASPVLGENGEILFILLQIEDVTEFIKLKMLERKEREESEELRFHTEEMELQIYQRALQIQETNQRLRLLNDELEFKNHALMIANRELESFSSWVAHDLRNPLSVIKSIVSLLRESNNLDQKGKQYLEKILLAESRMENLINDLLIFSGAIKTVLNYEDVDLSAIIKSLMTPLQDAHKDRVVNWIIQDNLHVHGDKRLLQIVLENLVSNSWKYTSQRPEAIIEFGEVQQSPPVYFIRDNGVGFSQEEADRLFLPFSRLSSSSDFPGTGIGLSIVKRIIERHGGKIWAEGVPDQGATFYFTLDNLHKMD